MRSTVLFLFLLFTLTISNAVQAQDTLPLDQISLPDGFEISVYVEGVRNARSLELSPNGTLFVSTRSAGNVYAVTERNGQMHIDTLASELFMPNGVVFRDGSLYVAEVNRILRYDDIEANLANPPEPVVVYEDLPDDRWHGWKYINFGPDGKLYVPVGAPCNVCAPDAPYASILRMNPDGTKMEVYATGVRNSVGFDWHPETGDLWFTDNGRDNMGNDLPSCELNRAPQAGMHFGFPYIHQGNLPDPEFGEGHTPADYTGPAFNVGPHVAPLGLEFYTGSQFPAHYKHALFIAQHGSWNREEKSGYQLMVAHLNKQGAIISHEPFAKGWLQGEEVWGRPVDVEQMPDGALLLSDDQNGVVYRISYTGG